MLNIRNINSVHNGAERLVSAYNKNSSKKWIIAGAVFICLIFSIFFLYQPARDYYISIRENDRLQAQYQMLLQTNQNLNNDIEALKSDEGIKQRATDMLGLVQQGESLGYVYGIAEDSELSNSASSTSSKVAYKNIKAPATWYSSFFNFIFNVTD